MKNTYTTCILFLTLCLTSFALDASERLFIWNEANAAIQNAKTPPEYLRAASIYQRLVDDGVRNGPLFYNIGTALLLAERYELSFNAFERAERYLGRQPDIDQNLKIALAKKTKSTTAVLPWYRLAAFWHFYLSCPQRISIASGAFFVFWLTLALKLSVAHASGLALRRLGVNPVRSKLPKATAASVVRTSNGVKRITNAMALFSLVVFVVFASSAAASWQMENSSRRYNLNIQPLPAATNTPATELSGNQQ